MAEEAPVRLTSLSDRALLRMFAQSGDEAAFRQLVDRHSALVLAACRRGLHSAADAEDAFQATFLVLARSAGKIRNRDALAAWLYGVATRICLRMRRNASRWRTEELMDVSAPYADPLDELLARHDETVADEELNAMPAALRTPLVLRYLAGKSNAEVAEEMGITIAALEGRLKRGKQRLRMRLLRRGVTLAAVVATLKATRVVASDVPSYLAESTVEAAISGAGATISALASEPTTSTHFALQELNAMNAVVLSKPVVAALAISGVAVAMLTAQAALSQGDGGGADPFTLNATASEQPASDPGSSTIAATRANIDPFATTVDTTDARTRGATLQISDESTNAPNPRSVDLKQRSKSEQAIEHALAMPLKALGLEFQSAPLSEVVDFLRDEYDIEIQIDTKGLNNEGVSPDEPITTNLRNISLQSALNLMLEPLYLTYIVDNEVLLITSEDEALTRMETRAYPADVLGTNSYELAKLITETIAPDSWNRRGEEMPTGEGAISTALSDMLVIRQTYDVHREINELLSQLRQRTSQNSTDARTFREAEIGKADYPTKAELPAQLQPTVDTPFGLGR